MSDLDENLTSILSSLIDTDAIEVPNTAGLPDDSSFNDSRLDFDNLASCCITGNDASLHQTSDENENVSSLLESHLDELSQEQNNTDIVESTAENLDNVTPFDHLMDKPIESLLETTTVEFISQECPEAQISLAEKVPDSQIKTTELNLPLNETDEILEDAQHRTSNISNGIENIDSTIYSNIELNTTSSQCQGTLNAESNGRQTIEEHNEIETNGRIPEICETDGNIENQSCEGENGSGEEQPCETIIADEIVCENPSKDTISKNEIRKRRRILVYNDGDSEASELGEERERLLQSKSPTPTNRSVELRNDENQYDQLNNEHSNLSNDDIIDENYIRVPNEKPGPKSKKQSTHLYNALKAKALLESAIVIPARKKKKKRVIDSDDEYSSTALNKPIASVDDIGLIPEDNDIQTPFNVSIEFGKKSSFVYVKKEDDVDSIPVITTFPLKSEINDQRVNVIHEPAFVKVEPLSRNRAQPKNEKHNANNNRRSHNKNEPRDIFGISLNA